MQEKILVNGRDSNFELLRIVAIASIVICHFCGQSAIAGTSVSANRIISLLLGGGNRIAVNVFLVLGTWFMVDAKFRPERILRLYLQVALYSIPITVIMLIVGSAGGARDVIQGLLPFFGRPLWFATAYISLIALSPFLNRILLWEEKLLSRLVFVVGFLFVAVATIPSYTAPEYLADFAWFLVVYVTVGWAKKTSAFARLPGKWVSLALGVGLCVALSLAQLHPLLAWTASYWNVHLQSIPNILSAVLIFNFFRLLAQRSVRWVNWLASSTFSAYIVHQVPAFREYEWSVVFRAADLANFRPVWFTVSVMAVPIALLLVLAIVDRIYLRPVERMIEKTTAFASAMRFLRWLYPVSA